MIHFRHKMGTFLNKIVDYFKITHPISEILPMMGLVTFESIAALKDLQLVIRVVTRYRERTGIEVDLGIEATLLHIGSETLSKGRQFFDNIDTESPLREYRSQLLKLMLPQVGKHVYNDDLKKIATIFRIRGGRQLYEILCANLPLPNISTVDNYIHSTILINEGEMRVRFKITCHCI